VGIEKPPAEIRWGALSSVFFGLSVAGLFALMAVALAGHLVSAIDDVPEAACVVAEEGGRGTRH
jgi:hypothetical protein